MATQQSRVRVSGDDTEQVQELLEILSDYGFGPVVIEEAEGTRVTFEGRQVERLIGVLMAVRQMRCGLWPIVRSVYEDDYGHYVQHSHQTLRELLENMAVVCAPDDLAKVESLDDAPARILGWTVHDMERIWSIPLRYLRGDTWAQEEHDGWDIVSAGGRQRLAELIRSERTVSGAFRRRYRGR